MKLSTALLLLFTLVAFAANSILCRLALISGSIGPVQFTAVRLGSGIVMLLPVFLFHNRTFRLSQSQPSDEPELFRLRLTNIGPAIALFSYAVFFSLAYVQLPVAVGALILFPSVQITMLGGAIIKGENVTTLEWTGIVISLAGLLYLMSPGLSAPPFLGTVLMIFSGVSWGVYSLLGKNQPRPILSTARNFLFCLPGVVILGLITMVTALPGGGFEISPKGILLGVMSGAIASAMGYVLWYLTLRRITTTAASVSQLAVPILAASGGIVFLNESLSLRLMIASALIVGGIVLTIVNRKVPESSGDRSRTKSPSEVTT
jgi:drug/metabolite transporter (DMT)-like permease